MPNFTTSANACLQQQLKFTNNSTGATAYEWDFCANDTETLKTNEDLVTITGLSGGYGYKVVTDGGLWFGFAVSQGGGSLYRLDFGSNPMNIPSVVNLGNPGGLLLFPNGLEIYHDGTNWYGFVGLFDPNGGIVRLDFGSSLTNNPTAQNLGMFGLSGRFWGAKVVKQAGDLILTIINRNTNSMVRVNYRNSFNNPIVNATHVFSDVIAGANLTPGFDITQVGNDWVALVASDLNSSIIQVKFTGDILSTPSVEGTYTTNISRPFQIKILKEGAHFVAAITSEFVSLKLVDYKDLNPINPPTEISHSLPALLATDFFRYEGKSFIHGVGATNKLKNLVFESSCGASINDSEEVEPAGVIYTTTGKKNIELAATNSAGTSYQGQNVTVSSNIAPDININTDGKVCINHDILFTAINASGNITNYNWSFGATGNAANHQFSLAGNYDVELQVASANCQNYVKKAISIFNEPAPNFTLPTNNPLCTNQDYVFDNTSTVDSGAPISWSWQVEGVNQGAAEDLTYAFTNSASQNVKLIASIPGCQNEITKNVNTLVDGPTVDFSFSGSCQNDAVTFTNNSSGSITSFSWDFGDGHNFIGTNTSNIYANADVYDVILTAVSPTGCNNTKTKSVTIRSTPQVNFFASPPPFSCSGTPTHLNDLTPNPSDSNLDTWQWNFDDAGSAQNTSNAKDPQHTYNTAGVYDVTLTVTTNFLCSASLQLPITISQTPTANFTYVAACEDVPTTFTDASGGTITAWSWQVGSSFYSGSNIATHTFANSGSVNASLMVTASNGCIASVTKPITIPVKVVPDFSVFKNCTNQQTLFTDVTNSATDPVTSQSWNFGGLGNGTGSPATFSFSNTGGVNVSLTVLAQSGCEYVRTKSVSIVGAPTASFTATPEGGGPPLEVLFTNTSTNATTYLWNFDDEDNTTSTDNSPTFTYQIMGEYQAQLTAFNALNCSHTVIHQIDVLAAMIEIGLNGLELIEFPDGSVKPAITVFNNGNTPISNLGLILNMSGPVIRERVAATIKPQASYRHIFQFEFPEAYQQDYFCIEADVEDAEPDNDKACLSLDRSFTILTPHPNPGHGQLNVGWILKDDGLVTVQLVNSMGQRVTDFQVDCQEGLTPLTLNTSGMGAGVYFLKIQYRHTSKVYRILISE